MQKRGRLFPTWLGSFTSIIYVFLYAPIVVLVILSFNRSRFSTIWQGFSPHWYELAWTDKELSGALRARLLIALITTVVATTSGTATALALARYRLRLRQAAEALVYLPVIIPEIVIGFSTAALFGLFGVRFGLGT